jgi:hypothetical protein
MLRPVGGLTPSSAADCYRYALSFPQVSACWSAPATLEQLVEKWLTCRSPREGAEARKVSEGVSGHPDSSAA